MTAPPKPYDESARIQALRRYDILDTPSEEPFDRVTRLARQLTDAPIALITFIDDERQWFKSCAGWSGAETARDTSFCGHAILGDAPLVVPDTRRDARFVDNPFVAGSPHIRFYAGVPLRARSGEKLGTVCVLDQRPRHLDPELMRALHDLAAIVERELDLRLTAATCPLTGCFTRRMLQVIGGAERGRAERAGSSYALLYLDLDRFKLVNDTHGHAAGDHVLAAIARTCCEKLRRMDTLFRIGGEEFAVLCVETGLAEAERIAERLRAAIAATPVLLDRAGTTYQTTVSIGVSAADTSADGSMETLLADADTALYAAKRKGRDRVVAGPVA